MGGLQGATVVITGAASGIGRAVAGVFAEAGASPVLVDIDEGGLERVSEELGGVPCRKVDVCDREAVMGFASSLLAEAGSVEVLVNCAGTAFLAEIVDTPPGEWRRLFGVNFWGAVHMMEAFLPSMYKAGKGRVVNVASGGGLFPVPGLGAYVATKYALVGLSEVLHAEARRHGVRVTVVCPWATRTPIIQRSGTEGYDEKAVERTKSLLLRFSDRPERVARKILRAVERDRFLLVLFPPCKALDLWHRLSRRSYLAAAGLLYSRLGVVLLGKDEVGGNGFHARPGDR